MMRTRNATRIVMLLGLGLGSPLAARADFVTIRGSSNANLTAPTTAGSFTAFNAFSPSSFGLVVNQFAGLNASTVETRSVIEFNVAALNAATIQSVTFNFSVASFTSGAGQSVGIYGFKDDGAIGLSDATAAATLLGSFDPTAIGLNSASVTLSGASLQSLVGTGGFLALRLQSLTNFLNTSLDSLQTASSGFGTAPSVSVTYASAAVPEPASLNLVLVMGSILGLAAARRRVA